MQNLSSSCDKANKILRCDCGERMELSVYKSEAGYYLGFICTECGPYSRESGYFPNFGLADDELMNYNK